MALKPAFATVLATAAAAALALGPSGAASASVRVTAGGNNGASVGGVTGVPAAGTGEDCPYTAFCIYTGTAWSGTRFDLYSCSTFNLYGWNGAGSWANHQTAGQEAWILGANGNVITTVPATGGPDNQILQGNYDWSPAWHVKPC
ncbi:peptidase inhibitor family I36 protein [Kitasatospora sp. RB6PN24]|uniref:peptidase inhibitor family I36 protein n=1 Tax=Kitasatospora humi TaxID=2893891 RepID=UPI001E5AC00D|nr:peptidase inhibitor family I36 protein [Kitasatospora humi]MCC9306502.1 peptidase inhibitor family I36 protein [Kitasatospora humi]